MYIDPHLVFKCVNYYKDILNVTNYDYNNAVYNIIIDYFYCCKDIYIIIKEKKI